MIAGGIVYANMSFISGKLFDRVGMTINVLLNIFKAHSIVR